MVKTLQSNKDRLVIQSVMGEISHPTSTGAYRTTFDGKPMLVPGGSGIKLNFRVGDPAYSWVSDHFEPGVCITNKGKPREFTALNALACIGNEAKVISGESKNSFGTITGKHGWTKTFVDFPQKVLEKLTIGDKIQVKGWGVGLTIKDYESIKIMSLSPQLFDSMRIIEENNSIVVPCVKIIEGKMMGSGMGGGSGGIPELGDFDIQSTCPTLTEKYNLNDIKIGDIIGIKDILSHYARGIYPGAITIGVVSHGASSSAGHGPGVSPIMSCKTSQLKPIIETKSNIAYWLKLRN